MSIDLEEGRLPPFKLVKSETVPLTKELVAKMRHMRPSPTERDLVSRRVDFLRARYDAGLFHTPHWVIAILDGVEYRANGQHSSDMLAQLNGEFKEGMAAHMDTFECPDVESLIVLFRQFDDRKSARTVGDVAGAYQGVEEALAELPRRIGKIGVEGITWHRQYVQALPTPKGDDRYYVFQEAEEHPFLLWLGALLRDRKAPEMHYPQVVGAMYATYGVNVEVATEFWTEVAAGGREFEEDHPTSVLQDWLRQRKEGDISLSPSTLYYQGCIYAWNAYRDGRDTVSGIKSDIRKGKLTNPK